MAVMGLWFPAFALSRFSNRCMKRFHESIERVYVPDRKAWRKWLSKNHAKSRGVWLVFDKKTAREDRLKYADAVEEALCFGWIDSTLRPLDHAQYMQLFTPRKPKSGWSKLNKDRVARLIEAGLMTQAGFDAIELAKKNGSWAHLDEIEAMVVPPDLAAALKAKPIALRNFEAFPRFSRKQFLYWLNGAKREETRKHRIKVLVGLAAKNERLTPEAVGRRVPPSRGGSRKRTREE
jgi:uncharacterized protein YdeI (YjbR/CyaY-like superfamily)